MSSPLQPCPTHCEEAKKICVNLENHSAGRSSQGSPTHKKVFLQKFDPKSEYLGEVVEIPFRVCGLKFGNIRYLNACAGILVIFPYLNRIQRLGGT